MTQKIIAVVLLLIVFISCEKQIVLKNATLAVGYALGEKIGLRFESNQTKNPSDSIQVFVEEQKSGYEYTLWAKRASCDYVCRYSTLWDGRKPDGNWPLGGRYLVYARLSGQLGVLSDTVQIGLGD